MDIRNILQDIVNASMEAQLFGVRVAIAASGLACTPTQNAQPETPTGGMSTPDGSVPEMPEQITPETPDSSVTTSESDGAADTVDAYNTTETSPGICDAFVARVKETWTSRHVTLTVPHLLVQL